MANVRKLIEDDYNQLYKCCLENQELTLEQIALNLGISKRKAMDLIEKFATDSELNELNNILISIQPTHEHRNISDIVVERRQRCVEEEMYTQMNSIFPQLSDHTISDRGQYTRILIDKTVLDFSYVDFMKSMVRFEKPQIVFTEELVDFLDSVQKNDSYTTEQKSFAKILLKFFAEGKDGDSSVGIKISFKNEWAIVNYCKCNNLTIVTNNYQTMLFAQAEGVKCFEIVAPKADESPFDSNCTSLCGIDASVISQSVENLTAKFSGYGGILICDITLRELSKLAERSLKKDEYRTLNFLFKVIANWGEVRIYTKRHKTADRAIVSFYSENPVGMVFTGDAGFGAFARLENFDYELWKNEHSTESVLTNFFNNSFDFSMIGEYYVFKDIEYNINNDYFFIHPNGFLLKRVLINVFRKGQLLENVSERMAIQVGDVVTIFSATKIAIMSVTSIEKQTAKVWYNGLEKEIPNKYRKYVTMF